MRSFALLSSFNTLSVTTLTRYIFSTLTPNFQWLSYLNNSTRAFIRIDEKAIPHPRTSISIHKMTPDLDEPSTYAQHSEDNPTSKYTTPSAPVSSDLHQQCLSLLAELDEFQSLLKRTLRNPQLVEVRQFRSNVNSELKMLQKLEQRMQNRAQATGNGHTHDGDPDLEERLMHAMRSSNLPFYQAVWNIAKGSCEGLVALGKRFYWDSEARMAEFRKKTTKGKEGIPGGGEKKPSKDKRKSVFVDIVARGGAEWVKVSTISESRLLFEMAKKGWERDSEDEYTSDEDGDGSSNRTVLRNPNRTHSGVDSDDDDELELIRLARDLRKAANATRVGYKHPRLRLVLPKIKEGSVPEIDDILKEIRSYGVLVECFETLADMTSGMDLKHLLPQPFKDFTPTLNVDCTLLLAMVSDLSHIKDIPPSPSYHRAINRQIEVENEQPLLPAELWPAMDNHELVCTIKAATRMREIVNTIGTDTEQTRTKIMMGDVPYDGLSRQALVQKFGELSDYPVPADWQIPVRVVDAQPEINAAVEQGRLPSVADEVAKGLSDINHGVFMYGWATGMTTISSNRTIDKQIETTIEKHRQGDDDLRGPVVWICDTARSLVGKDKDRKT